MNEKKYYIIDNHVFMEYISFTRGKTTTYLLDRVYPDRTEGLLLIEDWQMKDRAKEVTEEEAEMFMTAQEV